jgi:hypothetical protein
VSTSLFLQLQSELILENLLPSWSKLVNWSKMTEKQKIITKNLIHIIKNHKDRPLNSTSKGYYSQNRLAFKHKKPRSVFTTLYFLCKLPMSPKSSTVCPWQDFTA